MRTPNFKRWFGDWEAVRGLTQLFGRQAADMHGVERLGGKKPIEEAFRKFQPVETSDGRTVTFPVSMAGKIARHRGFDVGLVAGAFDQLLHGAVPMMSQVEQIREGHKRHPEISAYHHYVNRFALEGREYFIRFTAQEMRAKQGRAAENLAHSSFVSEVTVYANEKGAAHESVGGRESPVLTADGATPMDTILAEWLEAGKAGASEVVDPDTGEPMVVYHGSDRGDIHEFHEGGHFGDSGQAADRLTQTERLGAIYPVWLHVADPMRSMDVGDDLAWDRAMIRAANGGHDGIVYRNDTEGPGRDSWLVWDSLQVKSAIGNRGTFDGTTGNILHQGPRGSFSPEQLTISLLKGADLGCPARAGIGPRTGPGSEEANGLPRASGDRPLPISA